MPDSQAVLLTNYNFSLVTSPTHDMPGAITAAAPKLPYGMDRMVGFLKFDTCDSICQSHLRLRKLRKSCHIFYHLPESAEIG
jgi:hypothetical protein